MTMPTMPIERAAKTPAAAAAMARRFARALPPPPMHLHLRGELGAGKTLWARAVIKELGGGHAPSPSYATALSYPSPKMPVHHLDLFRLPPHSPLPGELSELLGENALCIVEWPERAADLPAADVEVHFHFAPAGRRLIFTAAGERGEECLRAFLR